MEWYFKNKKSERAHIKRRKLEIKRWFKIYKKKLSCSKCFENHPATLEFHHGDSVSKDRGVAIIVNNGCSREKIMEEIKKCVVLCANCHRKIHYKEKNNKL